MRIQYIIHADFELPGIIGEWARQNKFTENFCRPFAGESTPNPNDYDLLMLMGGSQSPLNIAESPYLADEISLIKKTIKAPIPILGFCLGAQLIGEAFGARTEQSPNKEVGAFPIMLTEEGWGDPLLKNLPEHFLVFHWHNDMPGITAEARILATSEGCPRQIIRYSPLIYGFQCHPELTKKNIEAMIEHCPSDLSPGKFIQSHEKLLNNNFMTINNTMIEILDNFIAATKVLDAIKTN